MEKFVLMTMLRRRKPGERKNVCVTLPRNPVQDKCRFRGRGRRSNPRNPRTKTTAVAMAMTKYVSTIV